MKSSAARAALDLNGAEKLPTYNCRPLLRRDGNGRIHRFLINDTLARDKAIPDGVILPVSATITSSAEFRAGYDRALEVFSRPFMRRYANAYRFGELVNLRSVKENGWKISGKLKKQYPQLEDERRATRILEAIQTAFEGEDLNDTVE